VLVARYCEQGGLLREGPAVLFVEGGGPVRDGGGGVDEGRFKECISKKMGNGRDKFFGLVCGWVVFH